MSLNDTPRSERLHIGIFGRRNNGKSSLINAVTGQSVALVSDVAGTTADPVYKAMEIHGIGPVTLIDTAGFDDVGALGALRVEKTREALDKTDVALIVFTDGDCTEELTWLEEISRRKIPAVAVLNKTDAMTSERRAALLAQIKEKTGLDAVPVSAAEGTGIAALREEIARKIPELGPDPTITGDLCREGDTVVLVMPQDIQAPKGRLILPQVQTIRELLDKKCLPLCVTTDKLAQGLAALKEPPALVIVDSQTFRTVAPLIPSQVPLTSFSILFAGYKGDIAVFAEGAKAMAGLTEHSRVLIAEACTHVPLEEDIGRIKIPRLLRQRFGEGLRIDFVRGVDFPGDLSSYDLMIHCGACMFNRRFMLNRIEQVRRCGVPVTNYGVALAWLTGILDRVTLKAGAR